jgi:hypothetical protein
MIRKRTDTLQGHQKSGIAWAASLNGPSEMATPTTDTWRREQRQVLYSSQEVLKKSVPRKPPWMRMK